MDTFKKIVIIILAASAIPAVLYFSQRKKEKIPLKVYYDTSLVSRYEEIHRADTVYKFTDRIVYKKAKPEVIYVQKTDSVFAAGLINYDLPLRVEKYGNELEITVFNAGDTVMKEYKFNDITEDFTITSAEKRLHVKTPNFYFEKPDISLKSCYLPNERKTIHEIGSETGISYRNKVYLKAGCGYNTYSQAIFLSLCLKLKGL